ncbi:hypothetical protein [Mangrovimicrobium sediminis]|uniref:hypothetical protein n=1 Tax=Mangrovimicrobium sediminis TaxID=2562682 RepID=UPI001F0F8799|nr:hypothetical protein [Haliea sp. SAOS-164]
MQWTSPTPGTPSSRDLLKGLEYMREYCEKVGREKPPEVFLASITQPGEEVSFQQIIDKIGFYKELGIVGAATHISGDTLEQWCENAEVFGAEVLAKID